MRSFPNISRATWVSALTMVWLAISPPAKASPDGVSAVLTPRDFCVGIDLAPVKDSAFIDERLAAAIPSDWSSAPEHRFDVDAVYAPSSAAARARYCDAVGRASRQGLYGLSLDAPGYLMNAFLLWEHLGDRAAAADAAYQLGLALITTPPPAQQSGVGARAKAADDGASTDEWVKDPLRAEATCGVMDHVVTVLDAFNLSPVMVLRCAAWRARDAACSQTRPSAPSCAEILGRADLRLARLLLVAAGRDPLNRAGLKMLAAEASLDGLAPGRPNAALAPPALRARLIGADLDTGVAEDPDGIRSTALRELVATVGPDDDLRPEIIALTGRVALGAQHNVEAAAAFQRAIALETRRPQPTRLPALYMLLAAADLPDRKNEHIQSAYAALDLVRPVLLPAGGAGLDEWTEESTFELHVRPVFEAEVKRRLAALAPDAKIALGDPLLNIIEDYREAELRNDFGKICNIVRAPLNPNELTRREMVLYPVILDDRIELLFLRGGGRGPAFRRLEVKGADTTREVVADAARQMRRGIEHDDETVWSAPSARLYNLLIAPIQTELAKDRGATLVVVPDATLSGVPFAALRQTPNSPYLIEQARLVVSAGRDYTHPGAHSDGKAAFTVAAGLETTSGGTAPSGLASTRPLAFGYFSPLAGTNGEARIAAGLGAASDRSGHGLILGDKGAPAFNGDGLGKALADHHVSIVHLATHASFSAGADNSFIVTPTSFITLDSLRAILQGHDRLDLLVLSACESALGDDRTNLGLAGAAIESGANSVIASLWSVKNDPTQQLMTAFYSEYRKNTSKAEALRWAQLQLKDDKDHPAPPSVWASMILVGGWR